MIIVTFTETRVDDIMFFIRTSHFSMPKSQLTLTFKT